MRNKLIRSIAICLLVGVFAKADAQQVGILDEVIAVVGEKIVLKSDLDQTYYQMKLQYPTYDGDLKCELFDQILTQKLLLYKAEVDSLTVGEERVNYEIDRRIEYYALQAGGQSELEKYLGMPLLEYKAQMRIKMKEEMEIQEAQNSIISELKVSPTEVRRFYEDIPSDSLPEFASEVEVAQLVIQPRPSEVAEEYARKTAEKLRRELVEGKREFCLTASIYSKDEGSKKNCGSLGDFKRGQMVPEFEAATFKLKKDSISKVVKTQFGYHIIQLIERKGEIANARHILIRPEILQSDMEQTLEDLRRIKERIDKDSISWCDAVTKYASDEALKSNCGYFTDPNVGSAKIEVTALESDVGIRVTKMKVGEVSAPHAVPQQDGTTAFRLLYLKSETPPHKASLENDYQKLAVYALEKKKQDTLNKWSETFRKDVHVWIDDKYQVCPGIDGWIMKDKN
ncbi:MAG: peptidylprolyl isomerase [Bacteroidia bacterium]|nr:peptidylprolyl isomerase [Bacteroidia bacterium]